MNTSTTRLIKRINHAEIKVTAAKLNRDNAYKAFADYIYQNIKSNNINRRALREHMGWKEHTLGNFLKQGDRLTEAEMTKLAAFVIQ